MKEQFPLFNLPAHWYKLDELSGNIAIDSGSSLNNGTNIGAVVNQDGYRRKCYDFSGATTNSVRVLASDSFSTFSFTCWLRNDNSAHSSYEGIFVLKESASDNDVDVFFLGSNGDQVLVDGKMVGSLTGTGGAFVDEVWTHLAIVVDSGRLIIYINGGIVFIRGGLSPVTWNLYEMIIGGRYFSSTYQSNFEGNIQDVRFFTDILLGQNEIKHIMNYGVYQNLETSSKRPNLYFPLNESTSPIKSIGRSVLESTSTSGTPDFLQVGKNGFDAINFNKASGDYFTLTDPYWSKLSNNSFTIMAWVNPSAVSVYGAMVLYLKGSDVDTLLFSVGDTGTPRKLRVLMSCNNNSTNVQLLESGTPNLGVWEHIAFSFNWSNKTLKVYRDGTEIYSQQNLSITSFMDATITDCYIGRISTTANYNYDGLIQDFKVFVGEALDPAVIAEEMLFNYSGSIIQKQSDSVNDLILWNKLGSIAETENSEVGRNGVNFGTPPPSYVTGKFGNGMSVPTYNVDTTVYFPFVFRPQGTIEMWWKPDFNSTDTLSQVPYQWRFQETNATSADSIFNQTVGSSRWLFDITDGVTSVTRVEYSTGFTAGTWYHLAWVWDTSGIDGSSDKRRFYFNNVKQTAAVGSEGTAITKKTHFGFLHINNSNSTTPGSNRGGKSTVDNLKAYSYAKTDFSDKDTEASTAIGVERSKKLMLWNRLSSTEQTINSEIGMDGAEGGTIVYTTGKFNTAASFIANSYLDFSGILDTIGYRDKKITIEFWHTFPASNAVTYALWHDGAFTNESGFSLLVINNNLTIYHTRVGDTNWVHGETVAISSYYSTAAHIAFVVDEEGIDGTTDTHRLYINGVDVWSKVVSPWTSTAVSANTYVGNRNGDLANSYCRGLIENLKIYNYAKTDFSDRNVLEPTNLEDIRL